MTIRFHRIFNQLSYITCLVWGEWTMMHLFQGIYFTLFLASFIYSFLLTQYYFRIKAIIS
jgi:hypothetical protein